MTLIDSSTQTRLSFDFPTMPVTHIKREFKRHNSLYAPTYIALDSEIATGNLRHRPLANARREPVHGKGKAIAREDPDFDMELAYIRQRRSREDAAFAEKLANESSAAEEEAPGIECGCCFTDNPFVRRLGCASPGCG